MYLTLLRKYKGKISKKRCEAGIITSYLLFLINLSAFNILRIYKINNPKLYLYKILLLIKSK